MPSQRPVFFTWTIWPNFEIKAFIIIRQTTIAILKVACNSIATCTWARRMNSRSRYMPPISKSLPREVMSTLEAVLPQIDALGSGLGEIDAELTLIIHFHGRLGLHFWSRHINNEFTAVYSRHDGCRVFQGFGEIFSDG